MLEPLGFIQPKWRILSIHRIWRFLKIDFGPLGGLKGRVPGSNRVLGKIVKLEATFTQIGEQDWPSASQSGEQPWTC